MGSCFHIAGACESIRLIFLPGQRLGYQARAQAAGANAHSAHGAIRALMPDSLQIGGKAAFCLDIGMADQVANLRFFAAKITLFAHFILPLVYKKTI